MKAIHHLLPQYAKHDGVGHHVKSLQNFFLSRGIDSKIFVEYMRDDTKDVTLNYTEFNKFNDCDAVIYHHSVQSNWPLRLLQGYSGKVITLYQNITPPEYFRKIDDENAALSCEGGIRQLDLLNVISDFGWTVSTYNEWELRDHGFQNVFQSPLIRDYSALLKHALSAKCRSDRFTILFVGRVTPNKCQHDLICLLDELKSKLDRPIQLCLVGGLNPNYFNQLKKIMAKKNLSFMILNGGPVREPCDVIFYNEINDQGMAGCYRMADLFVSASEHEGFCIPIVEAMTFGLPILAHPGGAVRETAGTGGIIIPKTSPEFLDKAAQLLKNRDLNQKWRQEALEASKYYRTSNLLKLFEQNVYNTTFFPQHKPFFYDSQSMTEGHDHA